MSDMQSKTAKLGEKVIDAYKSIEGNESATMPEQYSISYEVETVTGEIYTITKTVDGNGNIYFQSGAKEMLFISEDGNYVLYEKDADGSFTTTNSGAVYNKTYIDSVTEKIMQYTEKSKIQYMPGMKKTEKGNSLFLSMGTSLIVKVYQVKNN